MKQKFRGWKVVSEKLAQFADDNIEWFNEGQRASLRVIADRIPKNGLVLADEVGMGKTRIAVALARAVIESGGRVAILLPSGLGYQWLDELQRGGIKDAPRVLRSLWAYLAAWNPDQEPEQKPWFEMTLVLVSQAFANWRLGKSGESWRWALLPALYAEWRKRNTGRFPRQFYFHSDDMLSDEWVRGAAKSICSNIPASKQHCAYRRIQDLAVKTPWPGALDAGEYGRNENLRPLLEHAVGLGLGVFDLIIIDEAHKGRHTDSGLSRLLGSIVLQSEDARRLAVTATPVELDVGQWQQALQRIGVSESSLIGISRTIEEYAEAVKRVRQSWRSSEEARQIYKNAALNFQEALSPYLLRRAKQEDDAVRRFRFCTADGIDSYRLEKELSVDTKILSPAWRRAVCAAESLSLVTRQADDPVAKRLRLTMGSGHGIAGLIDQIQRDEQYDRRQEDDDEEPANCSKIDVVRGAEAARDEDKRQARAQWWRKIMEQVFARENAGLFDHPAILTAVQAIEEYNRNDEKVLVFGRFTRPLRALTELLNAREMLRYLQKEQSWPQSKVHSSGELDEWPAVKAAHRQLNCTFGLHEIDSMLESQYVVLERRREKLREHLFDWIGEGLGARSGEAWALLKCAEKLASDETRSLMARALDELLETSNKPDPARCAEAFQDLITALRDRDDDDADGDGDLDETKAVELWSEIENRLQEEYGPQRGTFARLMYGETKLSTRRTLQLAFNRLKNFPRVLVAQSIVGREGLNLHQACRVVVLLHPEWNPGVVEQQIGRVDRVGSHWSAELYEAIKLGVSKGELPRIEICPVIFEGTYDEYHWKVLHERWDDLRAQLHGIVVPQRLRLGANSAESELIKQLDEAGPNFSPLQHPLAVRL